MSIEQQLMEAFKRNESSLQSPPALDAQIMAEYRRVAMDKRGNVLMNKKRSFSKVAIIALLVLVLSGFAYGGTKLLFSDSQGQFSFRLQSSESLTFNPEELEGIRSSLKEIQAQLEPGQMAAVYLPELFKPFPDVPPLMAVTNPHLISDMEQWKELLQEQGVTELLPESLLAGDYQFQAGAIDNQFIGIDTMEDMLDDMELEYNSRMDNKPVWRIASAVSDNPTLKFTSIYRDSNGEVLRLNWEVIYDSTIVKMESYSASSTEYKEFEIDGHKVRYTKNMQWLQGDSHILQSVMWLGEKDGKTIIYSLDSDSLGMTKEKLIEAVDSLR